MFHNKWKKKEGIMQINTFQAIRFNSDYWNSQKCFPTQGTESKVKFAENVLHHIDRQIANGSARIDRNPGIYILRITSNSKRITSVIGEIDYNEKSVLFMNEGIHKQKLESYKSMFQKFKIQANPVLTFYKNGQSIETIVSEILLLPPTTIANIDGMLYELWQITDPIETGKIKYNLKAIERLYIADGHHRFSLFTSIPRKNSARLIISITDSNSILLKSCHRIIFGSISHTWKEKISQFGALEKINSFKNTSGKVVISFPNNDNYAIDFRESATKSIFEIVKKDVIGFSLGVTNYEENVFPLPGNIGPQEASKIFSLYKSGAVAIFIPSMSIAEFLDVIDNGHKLPATSTWFEPKIIDGFIVRKF